MLETLQISRQDSCPWKRTVELDGIQLKEITGETSPTGYTGCCRTVFIHENYVIKLGNVESELKLNVSSEDQPFLAEIVYADLHQRWYVQKRIDCVPNPEITQEHIKQIEEITRKYEIDDVFYFSDRNKAKNWTVDIHGQAVIFDYDFCKRGNAFEDKFLNPQDSKFPS